MSISKKQGDRSGEGNAYSKLGSTYRLIGDFQQSIEYHKKCLTIAIEAGDKTTEGCA